MATREQIVLDDVETKIFDKLLATCEHHGLKTVLRCAGGWVRDKLLSRQSHDIDIALDNMTGHEFALKVQDYLRSMGLEARSVGVVAANPEQSKHLETATLRVDGISLDFVNLRSETYSEGSRIPEMQMGTPLQDAERRDFTINSLFYNINLGVVEDFTGKGLADLRDGRIRTPLEPSRTFLDDPLRVLRAVRFASRFKFPMDDALVASARSDEVREALEKKITRERVGAEVAGMLQGPHPVLAMEHLHSLHCFLAVFHIPAEHRDRLGFSPQLGEQLGPQCIELLRSGLQLLELSGTKVAADAQILACLTALLLPLRTLTVPLKKGKTQPLAQHVLREALKRPNKEVDNVVLLHTEMETLRAIRVELQQSGVEQAGEALRVRLGNCLRKLKIEAPIALALFPLLSLPQAAAPPAFDSNADAHADPAALSLQSEALEQAIKQWGLDGCALWKPLMNGLEIQAAVELDRGGPLVGMLTTAVMDWQLANPGVGREPGAAPPVELVQRLRDTYAHLKTKAASGKRG